MVLLSWDVRTAKRELAWWVNTLVHGREVRKTARGREKTYRYPGYAEAPGVTIIGQSVLLLPPGVGAELAECLRARGIPCTTTVVYRRLGPPRSR